LWLPLSIFYLSGQTAVLPEYIAWYLNRPTTRNLLESMAQGTSLPTINIRDLGDLEIPIPPLDVQQKIAQIVYLLQQERILSLRLNRAHGAELAKRYTGSDGRGKNAEESTLDNSSGYDGRRSPCRFGEGDSRDTMSGRNRL